jgi:DNA helicase-2/ATP-dependent DNA helicase PcrA
VRDLVEELHLIEHFEDREGERGSLRGENIKELVSAMAEFEERKGDVLLADFLEEVSLLTDIDSWDDKSDAVTLMTLHNSKGLEFPRVYIAGMEEGLLPHARSLATDDQIEEERRLFYVGLTRAREKVTLTSVSSRIRYGEIAPSIPSRFLDEVPPELVEVEDLTENAPRRGASAPLLRRERSFFPDYENESQERVEEFAAEVLFRKGDRVRHGAWGDGTVTGVEGRGEETRISVAFAAGFRKKIMVRYASLEHFPRRSGNRGRP